MCLKLARSGFYMLPVLSRNTLLITRHQ